MIIPYLITIVDISNSEYTINLCHIQSMKHNYLDRDHYLIKMVSGEEITVHRIHSNRIINASEELVRILAMSRR